MKKIYFALISSLLVIDLPSQIPTYKWAFCVSPNVATNTDQGKKVVVDGNGNSYYIGDFEGTVDFDPGPGVANLTANGYDDVFFAKYGPNGNFLWAKAIGGIQQDYGWGIALDASNNVYITGEFRNTADFDPGVGTVNYTSIGGRGIFFGKYDTNGNYIWANYVSCNA